MLRKYFTKAIYGVLIFLATGISTNTLYAQQKRVLVDEVVAVVGNKMILLSDLNAGYQQYKVQKGLNPNLDIAEKEKVNIFDNMLLTKLLALNAIADSLPDERLRVMTEVEKRIADLTDQAGGTAALEKSIGIPLYSFRDLLTQQMIDDALAGSMKNKIISNVKVTPLEVKKTYKSLGKDSLEIIPKQIIYAQIIKVAPSDYDSKMKVKSEILELRRRIIQDGDSFSALARLYSKDRGSASRGGEMDYMPLTYWVPPFAQALKGLKPGQVSGVVETEHGYHIIQLIDHKNGLYKCRHILLKTEFDADQLNNAMIQLDSVANEIKTGKITFADAALKYSDDISSKSNDGIVLNSLDSDRFGPRSKSDKFYEDELGNDYIYLKDMKIGDVSESYKSYDNKDNVVCKIVKLIDVVPQHTATYEEDYPLLEEITLNRKRDHIFNKWINDRISKMYIKIDKPYSDFKFEYNWIK